MTFHLLAQTIVSGMYGQRLLEQSPKAMALLKEAMLRLIFENQPHHFSGRLGGKLLDVVVPQYVRKATDFMHAHMHEPLTVAEIAAAAGVSIRSLQAAFQHFQETTPVAYLRRIRLEAVRTELSMPENELPIREVALKWGFTHMSRFSAQYRAVYGVLPSDTVKRSQLPARRAG